MKVPGSSPGFDEPIKGKRKHAINYEIPLNLTATEEAAVVANRSILGDLTDRLYRHINRIKTGASIGLDATGRVVVMWTEVERKPGKVEQIIANWREYHAHLFTPKAAPAPKKPELTLADRVLSAHKAVLDIEGSTTVDQATRAELVALLGELAECAKNEKAKTQVQPCAGGAWHRRFVADVSV